MRGWLGGQALGTEVTIAIPRRNVTCVNIGHLTRIIRRIEPKP